MDKESKILILGAGGLIGQYLVKALEDCDKVYTPTSQEVDLKKEDNVNIYFRSIQPEYVFFCAAYKAGVEEYMKYPVQFLRDNLQMELNVIHACYEYDVKKLVYVGASCIYPESQDLLIDESYFATGWVQKATEPYALAKAAGTRLCEYYNRQYGTNYAVALLSNVYGNCDEKHFDKTSVIPAMITRFVSAVKEKKDHVVIWGTGENKREFLYVKDCARALVKIMQSDITGLINVGSGEMVSINELAKIIADITNFNGVIKHDLTKPNGSKRSVLDISKLQSIGWRAKYSLREGLIEMLQEGENNGYYKNTV